MKNIIFGTAMVLVLSMIMGISHANTWRILDYTKDKYAAALVDSEKDDDIFGLQFDTTDECRVRVSTLLSFSDENKEQTDEKSKLDISFRIDERKVHSGKYWTQAKKGETTSMLIYYPTEEFLTDLMAGNTLRVKIGKEYNTYSLSGSTKSILGAYQVCKNNTYNEKKYF